jgi:hypothetical protein
MKLQIVKLKSEETAGQVSGHTQRQTGFKPIILFKIKQRKRFKNSSS